jgi:ABC-type branched-subunit amino acid transport system ATPase component
VSTEASSFGQGLLGVVGRAEYGPFRDALQQSGLSWAPLLSLGLLGAAQVVPLTALALLGPQLSNDLGVGISVVLLVVTTGALVGTGMALARFGASLPRPRMVAGGGALSALALAGTGLASGTWQLTICSALAGMGAGVAAFVHLPLLFDHYRAEVRLRVVCGYVAFLAGGAVVAAALAVVSEDALRLTWRGAFLVLAAAALVAVGPALRLPEVPMGGWDAEPLRRSVRRSLGGLGEAPPELADTELAVGSGERLRQVTTVPSARTLLGAAALWGLVVVGVRPYLLTFWRDRWGAGWTEQVALYLLVMAGAAGGSILAGRRSEVAWRLDPARLVGLGRALGWTAALALVAGVAVPALWIGAVLVAVAMGCFMSFLTVPAAVLLSVVTTRLRPYASLALGAAGLIGALVGEQLLASVGSRFGVRAVLVVTAVVGAAGAGSLGRARSGVIPDLEAAVEVEAADEELRVLASQGRHLPLLGCRAIDFAYGQLQVLFDVDLTVDDGEMVALLGTNGAGKSTLLRVISGLGLPRRGAVSYRGSDITHLDPARRVRLGISQVPGGKAVFGPMTVLDNLRVFGFTHGRDQAAVDRGIEATFEAFPRLAERRHQQAATLSGGEQQMLALGKAFVLQPRLLLIDELSLGLAPIIVGELLQMVRRINTAGTAVVLVEQSVNIALSLVDHAYFMEKGQIRFDGPAEELVDRPDLLRSVFLEGAGAAAR